MTDLVRHTGAALTAMPLNEVMTLGDVFGKSGYFSDARSQAQCVVKIMAGAELGLPPIASMQGIHVIQGKPTLSSNLMAGAVKRSGRYDYRVLELTDTRCEIAYLQRVSNNWEEIGRTTFTADDARRADVKNMGKFPRNMLFARAMSNGVRFFCPDVFYGPVYTPEEFGGITDDSGTLVESPSEAREQVNTVTGELRPEPRQDEEADEAAQSHVSGKKRGDNTADGAERNARKAGLLAHKDWMKAHELDAEDKELARHLLGIALNRPVSTRADLSGAEWGRANHWLGQLDTPALLGLVDAYQQAKALRDGLDEADPFADDVVDGTLTPVTQAA